MKSPLSLARAFVSMRPSTAGWPISLLRHCPRCGNDILEMRASTLTPLGVGPPSPSSSSSKPWIVRPCPILGECNRDEGDSDLRDPIESTEKLPDSMPTRALSRLSLACCSASSWRSLRTRDSTSLSSSPSNLSIWNFMSAFSALNASSSMCKPFATAFSFFILDLASLSFTSRSIIFSLTAISLSWLSCCCCASLSSPSATCSSSPLIRALASRSSRRSSSTSAAISRRTKSLSRT
mmetsp:Transcript_40237/g.100653  ORF Transcript_40237/g.100653 Transcript_40237/m.100653 type:complete len:237 (+) Transcript_40237:165-875(+)